MSITITQQPANYQVIQRLDGSGIPTPQAVAGSFLFTGTTDDVCDNVQAQILDFTAPNAVVIDWTTIDSAIVDGAWSGTLAGIPWGGWYKCNIRTRNGSTVVTTVNITNRWGIGDLFVMHLAQSNGIGYPNGFRGSGLDAAQSDLASNFKTVTWYNTGAWEHLEDPLRGTTADGGTTWAVAFVNAYIAKYGKPIGILDCAVSGQGLYNPDLSGDGIQYAKWDFYDLPNQTDNLYGFYNSNLSTATSGVKKYLAWVCYEIENDSGRGVLGSDFYAAVIRYITHTRTNLGLPNLPLFVIPGARYGAGITDANWNAIKKAWMDVIADIDNVFLGAMIYDGAYGADKIHLTYEGQDVLGSRLFKSVSEWMDGTLTKNWYPKIISFRLIDNRSLEVSVTPNDTTWGTQWTPQFELKDEDENVYTVAGCVGAGAGKIQLHTLQNIPTGKSMSLRYAYGVNPPWSTYPAIENSDSVPLLFQDDYILSTNQLESIMSDYLGDVYIKNLVYLKNWSAYGRGNGLLDLGAENQAYAIYPLGAYSPLKQINYASGDGYHYVEGGDSFYYVGNGTHYGILRHNYKILFTNSNEYTWLFDETSDDDPPGSYLPKTLFISYLSGTHYFEIQSYNDGQIHINLVIDAESRHWYTTVPDPTWTKGSKHKIFVQKLANGKFKIYDNDVLRTMAQDDTYDLGDIDPSRNDIPYYDVGCMVLSYTGNYKMCCDALWAEAIPASEMTAIVGLPSHLNLYGYATEANMALYISPDPVDTPTISPAAGTYSSSQSVEIACSLAGASIYYTTDGSTPSASSTLYTGAITVSTSQTIKAIAIKSGYADSAVAIAVYVITVNTPVISPAAGTYTSVQTCTITEAMAGASVYYTTDGSTPDATKTLYAGGFSVGSSQTVKAIGIKSGATSSAIASSAYVINLPVVIADKNGLGMTPFHFGF